MEIASSTVSLVKTSLELIDKVSKDDAAEGIESIQSYLEGIKHINEKTADRLWLNDIRCIKRRIEHAIQFYEAYKSEFDVKVEGPRVLVDMYQGIKETVLPTKRATFIQYVTEIKKLTDEAKKRVETFSGGTTVEEIFEGHSIMEDPVGLGTPVQDVVHMLRDATRLRVVAISSHGTSSGSELARDAYNQVIQTNQSSYNAWVTASNDDDVGNGLIKGILEKFDQEWQRDSCSQQPKEILDRFLKNKRYIIGIDGVENTREKYWDSVISAFPDDNMSSRIIVITTAQDKIETSHKECPIYWIRACTKRFEGDEAELVQILSKGRETEKKVVTIYGPGGSGKTILAKQAIEKIQAEEKFKYNVFSRVANRDKKGLVLDILRQLGQTDLEGSLLLPDLCQKMHQLLKDERYMVVIDGLEIAGWWSDVKNSCPDNRNSSRIIVTTTQKDVATICSNDSAIYKMKPLDETSATYLLASIAPQLSPNKRKMILKICEGLPLAINNFGYYARMPGWASKTDDELEKECRSIGSRFVNNKACSENNNKDEGFRGMKHVVNRSYNMLDPDAEACFLSLSIYCKNLVAEDNPIKAKPLIRRLLAEGLISRESVADECFRKLTEQNFIVPLEFSIRGNVKTFRVSRMMPMFIDGKGAHQNYVTSIVTQKDKEVAAHANIARLCLHNESAVCPKIEGKVDHVDLLSFDGKANEALMDFKRYTFLLVLILEKCKNMKDKHLNSICSLKFLRYLSIRDNEDLKNLPENIVKIQSLQTLDTRGTRVHQISKDVILLLTELLHLFGKFKITKSRVEKSLRQKAKQFVDSTNKIPNIENSKLETLAGVLIDESPHFETSLPRMRELRKVKILIQRPSPPRKVTNDLVEWLQGKSPLHSLSIESCNLDFLDDIKVESPRSLSSLKLCGKLTKLPQFVLSFSVSLQELCLSETNIGGDVLLQLQKLHSLQFLKITRHHFELKETLTFQSSQFGRLQRLCFHVTTVPNIVIEKNAMEGLNSLQLLCEKLGRVSGILHLHRLEEVTLPSSVSEKDAGDLLEQVLLHSKKPKILDADGSIWTTSKLSKSSPFKVKTDSAEQSRLSRMDGHNKHARVV